MKRKITILLMLALLICALASTVSAAGSTSLAVSATSVNRGNTLTVTVKLAGVAAFNAGSMEVSCDSGLQLTGVTSKVGAITVVPELTKGRVIFYSMASTTVNGNLLALTFKVKDNAAFADNKITVNVSINGEKLTATATVNVACNHQFSNWAYYSATTHTRKCGICGKVETVDHTYDNDCDPTCNGCGNEREITHKFSEEWTGDETGHYHACGVCGEKDEVQKHTPGEEAGEYTDQICTVCKFVLVPALGHTHRYDETWTYDDAGHWQICTGCKEPTEAAAHIFDGDCDENCDTCGYQRQITHPVEDWEHSETEHWKTCSNCSEKLEQGAHTWDAGYVKTQATTQNTGLMIYHCTDCMAERQEVVPKALPTDPAGGWAWWIWVAAGFGGGIVLTSLIFTLIITVSVKKKSKGRFSN